MSTPWVTETGLPTVVAVSDWTIELLPNGTCDVTKDRRAYAYDLDFEEALDRLRREGADEVTVVELDGYRVKRRL